MNSHSNQNEGIRILEEFVCQAIPDPSGLPANGSNPISTHSQNEGILVGQELVANAVAEADYAPAKHKDIIHIVCPQCGMRLRVKPSLAGQRVRCPPCGAVFMVSSG